MLSGQGKPTLSSGNTQVSAFPNAPSNFNLQSNSSPLATTNGHQGLLLRFAQNRSASIFNSPPYPNSSSPANLPPQTTSLLFQPTTEPILQQLPALPPLFTQQPMSSFPITTPSSQQLNGFQSITIGAPSFGAQPISQQSNPQQSTVQPATPLQKSPLFSFQRPALVSSGQKSTAQTLQARLMTNRARQKNGKHLVMDLDETLVHTFDPKDNFLDFAEELTEEQKSRVYVLNFPKGEVLWGYVRPYAEDFLRVAFEEFDSVGVWSAGTSYYVNLIVQILFKDQQPAYVMSRDECNELVLKKEPMPCRFKPLEILYHRHPDHNEANTVIVDDRHDICSLNCMNNIRIPEYLLNNTSYPTLIEDITLLVLADWFQSNEFRSAPDIRKIKGRSPFKIE